LTKKTGHLRIPFGEITVGGYFEFCKGMVDFKAYNYGGQEITKKPHHSDKTGCIVYLINGWAYLDFIVTKPIKDSLLKYFPDYWVLTPVKIGKGIFLFMVMPILILIIKYRPGSMLVQSIEDSFN
jgi:hypothetical protein